ncbi:hypothetical protein H4S07_004657, partial [Coemansia furcata]
TLAIYADEELASVQALLKEKSVVENSVRMAFDCNGTKYQFEVTIDELVQYATMLPPLCNPPAVECIYNVTNLSHLK